MNLAYPTVPWAIVFQAWGNVNPKMYPAPSYRHMGIDVGGPSVGAPIYAACDGVVDTVNLAGAHGYGRHIIIQHDGFQTLYAHQHKVLVQPGQSVQAGLQIGEMGGDPTDDDKIDGASTGTHLHFEVILPEDPKMDCVKTVLGYTVDPFAYLLKRYGPAPQYLAKVVDPKGVRVRILPDDSKAARILYVLSMNETVQVVDVKGTDNGPWVKLLAMRDEWACAAYQGKKLLELTPVPAAPASGLDMPVNTPATRPAEDENAIRRDEVQKMIAMLEARLKELG